MKLFLYVFPVCFLIFFTITTSAQLGTLDETFGDSGKVITSFGDGPYCLSTVVSVQEDAKVVIAGWEQDLITKANFALVRYNTDGSLDNSFGSGGKVKTDFSNNDDFGNDMLIQPDGKIIVAGFTQNNSQTDFAIARYNIDGTLDNSFGVNGRVITDLGENEIAHSIALLSDGKIILGGAISNGIYSESKFVLVSYNPDGTIDSAFDNDGFIITILDSDYDIGISLAVQDDDKIVFGGISNNEGEADFALVRYTRNGVIDSTFGLNGIVITNFNQRADYIRTLKIQRDGKIVAGGLTSDNSFLNQQIALVRYNSNGTLDSSFGTNGKAIPDLADFPGANAIDLDSSDRIIALGPTPNASYYVLARFNTNGSLDSSFGINGIAKAGLPQQGIAPYGLAIQKDQKIVATGHGLIAGDTNEKMITFRFNSDAILPVILTSFTVEKNNSTALLNWHTCSEINCKGFYIDRSSNGATWSTLGFVTAKGGGSVCNNDYTYTDLKPLPGKNLYRLRQTDKDGKFTYSGIADVTFNAPARTIKISPNPVKNILVIEDLNSSSSTNLSIINSNGKVMATAVASGNIYKWNIQKLPAGTYFLVTSQNNQILTLIKFVKN